MKKILETERTYLREMTPDDAQNAYELNLDPLVIQYTGDVSFESVDEARTFLSKYDHYKKYGFGRWAVISKETNEYLGWCGLKYSADEDEFDIGFRFHQRFWNKGFASESARACIKLGFEKFNMETIVGRAMKENLASIRVLEKCGLTFLSDYQFDDEDGVIYSINKTTD
jgi:ribosomal-protein-alanine N-acetyltransferase